MKNKYIFKFLLLGLFSTLILKTSYSQEEFQIREMNKIDAIEAGYNATFSPDGTKILYSSINSNGLYLYELTNENISELNKNTGAGFEPCFSADGQFVYFKSFEFDNSGKRWSYIAEQNIESGELNKLTAPKRNLSNANMKNGNLLFADNDELNVYNPLKKEIKRSVATAVFTNGAMDLILFNNGEKKVLNPFGKGNYIWVSLSPDGSKILFNKAGKGTYVSDLEGNILVDLGRLHAAKWSADGNYIIGMNDYDDGHQYTSSKIVLIDKNGKNRQELELANEKIALYPALSSDNKKLVFNNEKGELFILYFEH